MHNHSTKYWIGVCKNCGQGQLIFSTESVNKMVFIMCDECSSSWRTPKESLAYYAESLEGIEASEGVFFLEGKSNPISFPQESWPIKNADLEDIKRYGWDKYVKGSAIDYDCV